jgi:hypothetical protein
MLLFGIRSVEGQPDLPTLGVAIGGLGHLRHMQGAPFVAGPSCKLPVREGRFPTVESSR